MRTITIWKPDHSAGISGGDPIEEFIRVIDHHGGAITEVGFGSWNHRVIGVGGGHSDAEFAETGRSHVAWIENDRASGPWWES